jgi:hypothetical protein
MLIPVSLAVPITVLRCPIDNQLTQVYIDNQHMCQRIVDEGEKVVSFLDKRSLQKGTNIVCFSLNGYGAPLKEDA